VAEAAREAAARASFERIYDAWFDDVARWVRALGVRHADAEDIVQDVFVVVHRRLHGFDGRNVAGWLYRITRRRVRDHQRHAWVKHFFGLKSTPPPDDLAHTRTGPLDDVEREQRQRLLSELLDTLGPAQRAAFVLFEMEGKSGEEIAQLQSVSVNTVWARVHRARKSLMRAIERRERDVPTRGR
jgi:RNA polymerase sigma-70 factor (ECF subfamily)